MLVCYFGSLCCFLFFSTTPACGHPFYIEGEFLPSTFYLIPFTIHWHPHHSASRQAGGISFYLLLRFFCRVQRCAIRSHQFGDIGEGDVAASHLLKGTDNAVVAECASLYDDFLS